MSAVLAHVDVAGDGWDSDPFTLIYYLEEVCWT